VNRVALAGSVIAALALASPVRAADEAAGTAAGTFLAIGTGTSVLSMGGATLASGNDLAAASWNVASLGRVDALTFSLAHSPLPGGATQDWLAGGGRLGNMATRWGLQALLHREGDIEGRDASNNPTGTLSANDIALGASLAQPLGLVRGMVARRDRLHEGHRLRRRRNRDGRDPMTEATPPPTRHVTTTRIVAVRRIGTGVQRYSAHAEGISHSA